MEYINSTDDNNVMNASNNYNNINYTNNDNDNNNDIVNNNITENVVQDIDAVTVEIPRDNIISYLKPQISKYWRFMFKNDDDKNKLQKAIEDISDSNFVVEFNIKQDTPDITIKHKDNIIGKINLLLCDRRDANLPEKYYCKLYFYQFKNKVLFQKVKYTVVDFFNDFKLRRNAISNMGHNTFVRNNETHKTRKTRRQHRPHRQHKNNKSTYKKKATRRYTNKN